MKNGNYRYGPFWSPLLAGLGAAMLLAGSSCSSGVQPSAETGEDNVLLTPAKSFEGSITGKVAESQSTRASFDGDGATQTLPLSIQTEETTLRFLDLEGNRLRRPDGRPIDDAPVNQDGSFAAQGLPVGTDFTLCVDIGRDERCDLERHVNIPASGEGEEGELTGVTVDPLTTMVLARLRQLLASQGIDLADLPVSPAAVVTRIVEAYANLFEESGIDQAVSLADIENLSPEELADLFDAVVPAGARTGMRIVDGSLKLVRARDAEALALAVAEVFLRAGFPIVDLPGPPDLGPLGELDGIISVSRQELFGVAEPIADGLDIPEELLEQFPEGIPDEIPEEFLDLNPDEVFEDLLDELASQFPEGVAGEFDGLEPIEPAESDGLQEFEPDVRVYTSTFAEPNRNFANGEDGGLEDGPEAPLPVLNDFILLAMARLQLEDRQITLGDLHDLLTNLDDGLGARLTYAIFDPTVFGPPLNVFETADGRGKAIDLEKLLLRFFEQGFHRVDAEDFASREEELRALLRELLGDTVPPAFDRLFRGIINDRVTSAEELAHRIRSARAHLPFNRSGSSSFFVIADGDPFRHVDSPDGGLTGRSTATAVTVDVDVTGEGEVRTITYNPGGTGRFYLGFTENTEDRGSVELLVRETGRFLHGPRGPLRVSLFNDAIFGPVDGQPFAQYVSETGVFFPGTQVTIIRDDFAPDGEFNQPHEQLFVLATGIGEGAEPVRVDFDRSSGLATFNPAGRHLLMFLPDSHETGLFALFNEDTGRPASLSDPSDFFLAPIERPEDFEDSFNQDQTSDPGELEPLDEPADGVVDDSGDGTSTEEGETSPDDGTLPPPDGGVEETPDAEEPSPAELVDGEPLPDDGPIFEPGFITIAAREIIGLELQAEQFTHVFGIEVPNDRYDSEGDPYFDDINDNGLHDPNEPTAPFRPALFHPDDWRSTDIRFYYRRADNGASVSFEDVAFDSDTPRTIDGVALVPRTYRPRENAFRFGRPNTAINLLTAFAPPDFFDGTHRLDRGTAVDVFMAVAIINLVMEQVFNVEADIDIDGQGPLPRRRMLIDAHMFVAPIGDPFQLLLGGFRERSTDGER